MLDRKPAEELKIPFALIFYLKISLSSISLHSETFHFQPRNFSISFVSCLISDACFPLHLFLTGFLIFSHRFSRDPALTNVFHDQTFKYIFFRLIGSSTPRSYLLTPVTVRIPVYLLTSADNLPGSHQHQIVEQNLFYMWRLTFENGEARLCSVTKNRAKSGPASVNTKLTVAI